MAAATPGGRPSPTIRRVARRGRTAWCTSSCRRRCGRSGARSLRGVSDALRALPPVDAVAAAVDAPRAVAVAAARAALGRPPGRAARRRGRRAGRRRPRPCAGGRERAALAAAGDQRDRRDPAHEPRPGAARGRRARGGRRGGRGLLDAGARPRHRARAARATTTSRPLLRELTGAEAALVVNNGAGAALLAVAALAGPGREVVVSRGQLVEIGGGFRVPEVIAQAGARLVEVGHDEPDAPRRLRARDRRRHGRGPARPPVQLPPARLRGGRPGRGAVRARAAGDRRRRVGGARGSGSATSRWCAPRSRAGAALVGFSGDKLLGGPQAGLLVGRADAVARARAHPLARALRIDKLSLAALEATLRLYREPERARRGDPGAPDARRRRRGAGASGCAAALGGAAEIVPRGGARGRRRAAAARAAGGAGGGGPRRRPPTRSPHGCGPASRRVVARIEAGRLLLDPRTLADDEVEPLAAAVRAALG